MVYHKNKRPFKTNTLTPVLAGAVMVFSSILHPVISVKADSFDDQIRQKQEEQVAAQAEADKLAGKADTIEEQITKLQNQIASIQAQIDTNTKKQNDLTNRIEAAQKRLEEQKVLLSANIRSMYIEGDISPLEMLASSSNISDFVDKQEYRDRIKESITSTLDEIEVLKKQLDEQRQEIIRILDEQRSLRADLKTKESEANSKLNSVNQSKASFDKSVKLAAAEITALREQQIAAMQRVFGGTYNESGSYGSLQYRKLSGNVSSCGGGYPSKYCSKAQDSIIDEWRLYNRECVSYAAWAMQYRFGHSVSSFGGAGNAYEWPITVPANRDGYKTDTPTEGSVLVIPRTMIGGVGHVAVVEEVYGDGWFRVSQYNWSIYVDGKYSTMDVKYTPGLKFLVFTR